MTSAPHNTLATHNAAGVASRPLLFTLAAAASLLLATLPLAAQVYDGFEGYTPGGLGSQNGGTGWNGAWTATSAVNVVAGGLGYAGGVVLIDGGDQSVEFRGEDNNSLFSRTFSSALGDVDAPDGGDEFYFSFLLQHIPGGDPADFVQLFISDDADTGNSVGMGDLDANGTTGNRLGARMLTPTTVTEFAPDSINPYLDGETYFFVGRASKDGALTNARFDKLEMWINPTSLTLGMADAVIDASTDIDGGFDTFAVRTVGLNGDEDHGFRFDEFRAGNTAADVITVIPEPTAGALLLCLAAGISMVRRRHVG